MRALIWRHVVPVFALAGGILIGILDFGASVLYHMPDSAGRAFQLGIGFFFGGVIMAGVARKAAKAAEPTLSITMTGEPAIGAFLASRPDIVRDLERGLSQLPADGKT